VRYFLQPRPHKSHTHVHGMTQRLHPFQGTKISKDITTLGVGEIYVHHLPRTSTRGGMGNGHWASKLHNLIRITNHYYTWSVALMVMGSMVMTRRV
jgi:hypothetical protein